MVQAFGRSGPASLCSLLMVLSGSVAASAVEQKDQRTSVGNVARQLEQQQAQLLRWANELEVEANETEAKTPPATETAVTPVTLRQRFAWGRVVSRLRQLQLKLDTGLLAAGRTREAAGDGAVVTDAAKDVTAGREQAIRQWKAALGRLAAEPPPALNHAPADARRKVIGLLREGAAAEVTANESFARVIVAQHVLRQIMRGTHWRDVSARLPELRTQARQTAAVMLRFPALPQMEARIRDMRFSHFRHQYDVNRLTDPARRSNPHDRRLRPLSTESNERWAPHDRSVETSNHRSAGLYRSSYRFNQPRVYHGVRWRRPVTWR